MNCRTLSTSTLVRMVRSGLFVEEANAELRARMASPTLQVSEAHAHRSVKQSGGDVDMSRIVVGWRARRWRGESDRGPVSRKGGDFDWRERLAATGAGTDRPW